MCRFVATEVSKHVTVLHVMRSCELEVRSARRFPNVVKINIGCLLSQDDGDDDSTQTINFTVVGKIAPFLSCFAKLEEADLFAHEHGTSYNASSCGGPNDHRDLYKALLISLCGAFETNSLSQSLKLPNVLGFTKKYFCSTGMSVERGKCSLCRSLLLNMPLCMLVDTFGRHDEQGDFADFCLEEKEVQAIIRGRVWTQQCFQAASECIYVPGAEFDYLISCLIINIDEFSSNVQESISSLGPAVDPKWIRYMSNRRLSRLEFLASIGCSRGLGDFPLIKLLDDNLPNGGYYLLKSTFDRLRKIGYTLDETKFVLIDEEKLPRIQSRFFDDFETRVLDQYAEDVRQGERTTV